jgi:hypothetical protein
VRVHAVPEWSIDEDRPTKRHGIEDMVSSRDISSDANTDLGDEVCTPWLLQSATTLEENESQSSGVLIRREDGALSSSVLFGEGDYEKSGSVQIRLGDKERICSVQVGPEDKVVQIFGA